ncbi:MAG: cytochrome C oxidase subunit IV family protein [Chthonomonadales bacterium]
MSAEHAETTHQEHSHHVVSVSELFITYGALMGLMLLTIAFAFKDFGAMNNVIAMVIALIKATLVVLFFMQVRKGSKLTMLWAAIGFIWFLLMFGIMSDYFSRAWIPVPGWESPTTNQK